MASPDVECTVEKSSLPKAGADDLRQTVPADSSLDVKCPLCLERFDNMFCLNPCLHKSCFSSVQAWSEAKAECPLCKQPGQSVFHSAGAGEDSKEYVSMPSENHALSKPGLWELPYPTSREPDTAVSLCKSSSSRQTDDMTSNIQFSDQRIHPGVHEIHEVMGLFAVRRQLSADRTYLGPSQKESAFDFIPVLQRFGVQVQQAHPHRDFSARSQMPSLMNMMVVLVSSGVLLFVCFYLYLSVILLHK
ncbi:E3 ubiquitin-protein ligase Topors-like isoform X2 [Mauremys mutica]|nr:E3 ubiquitin-protein ligase Topors-like isoform X2 [Mauremys mutica]XP_044876238.1 E3 ubiquitin-protein ligase Topors-like isoform X2 [Mauremys mutica]XP_044876239.1 E3 ubiquitin-protein ligase Topors-like isoform X2 [Mauremys mutica]XP_044876241.1 E3 ubiquitin-protein ligase Topors-like isoform X2 [Mauremys mutica]